MKIEFYPYDFDYKIKDGQPCLYMYSKLADGTKICVLHRYQPYFYIALEKVNVAELEKRLKELKVLTNEEPATVVSSEKVEKELLGKRGEYLKVYVNYPKAVPAISREVESWGLNCYEKDILFIHRYLRDCDLTPLTLIQAEGNFLERDSFVEGKSLRIPQFLAGEVKQASKENPHKFKILALDIETYSVRKEIDPQRNPILMIRKMSVIVFSEKSDI